MGDEFPLDETAMLARADAGEAEQRRVLTQLREARDMVGRAHELAMGPVFVGDVVQGVEERIRQPKTESSKMSSSHRRRVGEQQRTSVFSSYTGVRTAAILGLGLVISVGGLLVVRSGTLVSSRAPVGHTYVTAIGQQATIALHDGSKVTLAPQTQLVVAPGFGKTARRMSIDGEAFFEVAAGKKAPFIVQTGNVSTQVLGTTFSVRKYPEDRHVSVAVVDGKVEVTASSEQRPSVVLAAGMLGIVTDSSATAVKQESALTYASWMRGRLVFQEVPVSEILAAMRRWYGYEFRVTDSSLTRQHLTVGISSTSASDALAALKMVWGVEFGYQDSVIIVSPSREGQVRPPAVRDGFPTPKSEVGR